MPTYQYTCTDCGEPVEAVQKFTDAPLTVCAACGGRLRKVFSPVGIVFKGSGFYRTDSRNGSSASAPAAKDKEKASSDSSSSSSESSSSSSNGSDSKPAAKKTETAGTSSKSSASEKVA
ncbi:MAG TPA: FmdB family zinc ribbon protein [Streptosporangiaceae bacterium]|nr:FmdB family zinc ribbon protein [Streptosporangiaceae bacterium]